MKSKSPEHKVRHLITNESNAFDVYREGWNKIQDRMDRDYQNKLKKANQDAFIRMQETQKKVELKLREKMMLKK